MKRSLTPGWLLAPLCILLAIAAVSTTGCSSFGPHIVNPE